MHRLEGVLFPTCNTNKYYRNQPYMRVSSCVPFCKRGSGKGVPYGAFQEGSSPAFTNVEGKACVMWKCDTSISGSYGREIFE